jgi:hypothetical protein
MKQKGRSGWEPVDLPTAIQLKNNRKIFSRFMRIKGLFLHGSTVRNRSIKKAAPEGSFLL